MERSPKIRIRRLAETQFRDSGTEDEPGIRLFFGELHKQFPVCAVNP